MALAAGAQSVTSIEYNVLDYDHPRISTVTNAEWYGKGGGHSRGEKFDVIFSISTFEHDGLGRYGDAINPDADIEGAFAGDGVLCCSFALHLHYLKALL